jgi:SAM-dependent methyltransferase
MADLVREEIDAYYATGAEGDRLGIGYFPLERVRTETVLGSNLPPASATVLDIGGGTGPYARSLTAAGYQVHLLDPIPNHVERAREPGPDGPAPATATLGDARELPWADAEADAALLLGPLYHLPDRADRERALAEAARVLRPGGVLLVAGVSRLSVPLDGILGPPTGSPQAPLPLRQGVKIVIDVLRTGRYRNPTGDPNMFTTAYMHTPSELKSEIAAAGFEGGRVHAVEGPGAWMPGFDQLWRSERGRRFLCGLAESAGHVPWLRAVSPHLLVSARKPI